MIKAVSKQYPLLHYKWGNDCDGWNLLEHDGLVVKQERMLPGTSEQLHYHEHATQFFFILKGTATFEIDGQAMQIGEQEGLTVDRCLRHRILNNTNGELEFILVSQPSTVNDRINIP